MIGKILLKRGTMALRLLRYGAMLAIVLESAAQGRGMQPSAQQFLSGKSLVWGQKWDRGNWEPVGEPVDARSYIDSFTPDGKRLGMSVCESCQSVRIVDCDRPVQRLLLFRDATAEGCAHRWKPAVTRASLDPIAPGDLLFAVYDGRLFAIRLGRIASQVEYEVAEVPSSSLPSDVNVAALNWQEKRVSNMKERFTIGDRGICLESVMEGQRMTIGYDHYYGYLGGERGLVYENPVFVAIAHKADVDGMSTVDVSRFHFKTWEDGLSNLSDPKTRFAKGSVPEDGVPSDFVRVDARGGLAQGQVTYAKLHEGVVWKVAGAPDGTYLASAGQDGQVVIYYLDKAMTKVIGPFRAEDARFFALAISRDGAKVAAAGDFNLSILVVDVTHDRQSRTYFPKGEWVKDLQFCSEPLSVAFLTSTPELLVADLAAERVSPLAEIPGDLLRSVFSPACEFTAVVVIPRPGTTKEISRLLILDRKGHETMSLPFDEPADIVGSAIVFLSKDRLGLCLTQGGMMRWQWSPRQRRWESMEKLSTPPGFFSAAIASEDRGCLWLAQDARVLEVDLDTGRILGEVTLEVGESLSNTNLPVSPVPAITDLAFIPRRNVLVAGLRDGRIALISLSERNRKGEDHRSSGEFRGHHRMAVG